MNEPHDLFRILTVPKLEIFKFLRFEPMNRPNFYQSTPKSLESPKHYTLKIHTLQIYISNLEAHQKTNFFIGFNKDLLSVISFCYSH